MEIEILYFSNGRGGTAISLDDGEHVVLANGRVLPQAETTWEEADEDDCGPLSAAQQGAIQELRDSLESMTEEQRTRQGIIAAYRRRRVMKGEKIAGPEIPKRELSPSVRVEYSPIED